MPQVPGHVQDQALHDQYLTPYEGGFIDGQAAATMCSYQLLRDKSPQAG